MNRPATQLRPEFLLHKLADAGAALTLHPDGHRKTVVIAPEIMLKPHELIYHVAGESLPEGMHHLHFDAMAIADEQHIDFFRNGERAASLCPVEVEGEKSLQLWTLWQAWRADHEVEYYEGVTTALRDLDEDGE